MHIEKEGKDTLMRLAVVGSFLIAILHSILFYGQELGISVFLFCIALGFFIIYVLEKCKKIKNKKALILCVPILLISATYFIFNNSFFYVANIFALIILFVVMIISALFEKTTLGLIINRAIYLLFGPIEFIEEAIGSIVDNIVVLFSKKEISEEKNGKIRKIIVGIVIAIPILIVILVLLASADSIFSKELGEVINTIFSLDIFESETYIHLFFRAIIVIIITVYLIALLYNILEDDFTKKDAKEERNWTVDSTIGNTILTILNLVYLVFCYIQISVLFMRAGNMENFDYASYARQGFFQLMAVSVINLIIILVTSKRNEIQKKMSYTKVMNLCLALFTLIILFSSFYRMYLYEQEYGYTFLRLMVYFALITEAILIIPTVMYILDMKINLTKTYFVVIIIMYLIVNYINIDNVIAKKNIDRYFEDTSGSYELDMSYLGTLGIDAARQIKRLENVEENNIDAEVRYYLSNVRAEVNNMTLQSFNINKFIARYILSQ